MTNPWKTRRGLIYGDFMPRTWEIPEVWTTVLRAADKLGIQSLFLRVVASLLPDDAWLSNLITWEEDSVIIARVGHSCGPACPLTPATCLTAFKVEEWVLREKGLLYGVDSLVPIDGDLEIRLRRLL